MVRPHRATGFSMKSNRPNVPQPFRATTGTVADGGRANTFLFDIKEEEMDETARTLHVPLNIKEEDEEEDEDDFVEAETNADVLVHQKVAEIASKAYHRASAHSNVLSGTKIAEIALVRFDELEVGDFLGKGSFSNVHEITKISAHGNGGGSLAAVSDKNWNGPRKLLTQHYQREASGTMRYAIKFLKEEIRSSPQKYAVGTSDLVVEGMFLASLEHPNIIKVRGLPEGGVNSLMDESPSNGYFLVLDRLFDTLGGKMYGAWSEGHSLEAKKKFGVIKNKKAQGKRDDDLAVRVKVAFDLSAALKYLHSKNIIYRDLKPENLGFDVRGDIKLFDLGLVKELDQKDRDRTGNFKLSMAGTPRYMSPECAMYKPYNLSADVYSFSMLLWEILTLEKPLEDYNYTKLKNEIFIGGGRPKIGKVFNKKLRALVEKGWSQSPIDRPTMDVMYDELRSEYLNLAPNDTTVASISHNRRRSTHMAQGMRNAMSIRHLMNVN